MSIIGIKKVRTEPSQSSRCQWFSMLRQIDLQILLAYQFFIYESNDASTTKEFDNIVVLKPMNHKK